MDKNQQLLQMLYKYDIITYKMLEAYLNTQVYSKREAKLMEGINKRLFSLFCKMISKEDVKSLNNLQKSINSKIQEIDRSGEWCISENGCVKYDNYQYLEDPEFTQFDTYRIDRDSSGYYVPSLGEEINNYEKNLNFTAQKFLEAHKEQFEELNHLINEKENIMKGNYTLRENVEDDMLPSLIAEHLGYGEYEPNYKL